MPRILRIDVGGEIYHVINRANARLPIFFTEKDYKLFELILEEAQDKFGIGIFAYCLMPNHFHLVLQTYKDNELQRFMQWLTLTHTQRWHTQKGTIGTGHLYQGRYKSFLIQGDKHLLTVTRYVERNALRAKLVKKAEDWKWTSLHRREKGNKEQKKLLAEWPIEIPKNYLGLVNEPHTNIELESLRNCVNKCKPFGSEEWTNKMVDIYKLGSTIRGRGRQIKGT